ncbi:LPS export ABC transporter periplasmic protein LptC [Marinilabilia rubra]|uniref:LPS export ABC transporter periplasmic protein LptC n=1 Tax=Marinilabilia rubra TaxID=2162893 RepID=A0A2U2BEC9_9BACT|nr:LPS export ABC transporter periplasmic protein LptC [Marinilabilia rubra]PWE01419.1 LPS export ABC transporter periplasmic protein LptC [Marinilabilia rubra]
MRHNYLNSILTKKTAGSIFILLAVLFFSGACQSNKPSEIKAVVDEENFPSLAVNDLETVITDSGRVAYRFISPEMNKYDNRQEPYTEFPRGLHLIVYNKQEEIDAQIKSRYAIYHEKDELWELQNNVEAVNFKNEVINTEQLFWDAREHRIFSDEFIKITTDQEILTGYGFESDESLENYTIKNISGILAIEEEETR